MLDTQRETSGEIKTFSTNFANLADTLKASDLDLRLVLDRGAVASEELDLLIRENRGSLSALLANLITIGRGHHRPRRRHRSSRTPTSSPAATPSSPVTAPPTSASLSEEPKVRKQGYEATKRTDPNRTTNLPPVNTGARCTLPRGSASTVRGAQNAPGPSRSGSNSSVPLAIGGQPVPPGASASLGMAAPDVSVPLPPGR